MFSAEKLIYVLNPIITGWSNYHQPVCASKTFKKLDEKVYKMLWKWAERKHKNKGKRWIANKYWLRIPELRWHFTEGKEKLKSFSETPIVRHTMIAKNKNPYLNKDYFEKRKRMHQEMKQKAYKRRAVFELRKNISDIIEA